jgi:hypothetical protein
MKLTDIYTNSKVTVVNHMILIYKLIHKGLGYTHCVVECTRVFDTAAVMLDCNRNSLQAYFVSFFEGIKNVLVALFIIK